MRKLLVIHIRNHLHQAEKDLQTICIHGRMYYYKYNIKINSSTPHMNIISIILFELYKNIVPNIKHENL
jgi:hypothetical protein